MCDKLGATHAHVAQDDRKTDNEKPGKSCIFMNGRVCGGTDVLSLFLCVITPL